MNEITRNQIKETGITGMPNFMFKRKSFIYECEGCNLTIKLPIGIWKHNCKVDQFGQARLKAVK